MSECGIIKKIVKNGFSQPVGDKMKKVFFTVLLLIMNAALFAGVSYVYPSWHEICDRWEKNYDYGEDFRARKAEHKAEYETAIRDILPFFEAMHAEAEVTLDFDRIADPVYGTTVGTEITYTTDDMSIAFSYMHLETDGLHAYAVVYNYDINADEEPVPLIALSFEEFVMKSDGTFISGQCTDDDYDNLLLLDEYGDVAYSLLESHLEERNGSCVIVCNDLQLYGDMYVPGTYEHICLKIGAAVIDWNGKFLSYSPCDKQQYIKICDKVCQFTHVELHGDELVAEGHYRISDFSLDVKSNNIIIPCYWPDIVIDDPEVDYTYEYLGYRFKGHGICWDDDYDMHFYNSSLEIFGTSLPFGELTICGYGWDAYPEMEKQIQIPGYAEAQIFGNHDRITNLVLTDEGIRCSLISEFPAPYTGQGFEYTDLRLNPNGTVEPWKNQYYLISYSSKKLTVGSCTIQAADVWQDDEGFNFSDAILTFPDNCIMSEIEYGIVVLENDGTITADAVNSYSALFNEMGTILDTRPVFTKDTITLEGGCWLPAAVSELIHDTGVRFHLELNYDGSVKSFKAESKSGGQVSIPETQVYLSYNGYSLESNQRITEKGLLPAVCRVVLKKPSFYIAGSTSVPKRLSDISANGTVAFNMDGTLCYKMPDDTEWQPLNLKDDNLFNNRRE